MSDSSPARTALDHEPAAKRRCLEHTTEDCDEATNDYSNETHKEPTEVVPDQEVAFHDEKEESKPLSKKHLFGLQHPLPRFVELEILGWLRHTGSFACTSKAANATSQEANNGQVCCPSQQFHHPLDHGGLLIDISKLEFSVLHLLDYRMQLKSQEIKDEIEEDSDWMGLSSDLYEFKCQVERARARAPELRWSCCASHFFSTGCMSNTDVAPEEAETAMEANEGARSNAYEVVTCFSAYSIRYWDEYIGGKPYCTCGYADGVCSYCTC
jgi:hypothetical protein